MALTQLASPSLHTTLCLNHFALNPLSISQTHSMFLHHILCPSTQIVLPLALCMAESPDPSHLPSLYSWMISVSKKCGEKGPLAHHWWEHKLVSPLCKTVWSFLKEIKNKTIIWPKNSTLRHILKRKELSISKKHLHSHVHCNTIHNSQDM